MIKYLDFPIAIKPCIHLQKLRDALSELDIDLNDGYADWFVRKEHNQAVRIRE